MEGVAAIVPAYNEASRIGEVLGILVSYPGFSEVIVVDDGSTDDTTEAAKRFGVRVVRNERNPGKGAALARGVEASGCNIFFFCDADIAGLTHEMIARALTSVAAGGHDLFVLARKEKERRIGPFSYAPLLDGQRALTRELWERVPAHFKRGFAIETALNHYARALGHQLCDITQTRKEAKLGRFAGTLARYGMYREIVLAKMLLPLWARRL